MFGACVYLKKIEVHCFIVALFTILTSMVLIGLSIMYLLPEENHQELRAMLAKLHIADNSVLFLSTITLLGCSIWMVSGVLLVVGVQRNFSTCVLFYFVYGIFFTIMMHVASLLLLLHEDWAFGLGIFIISLIHIRGLVTVYQAYDLMLRGKQLGTDEDPLVDDDDILSLPDNV